MPPKKKTAAPPAAPDAPALVPRRSNRGKRSLEPNSQDEPKPKHTKSSTAASATIEDVPDWAYDVTSIWEIDASNLSHDLFFFKREYPDAPPPFTMHIKYANDPRHKNIGRQLWATFTWGKMSGVIRMCPGHKYITSHLKFYDSCILKSGVWPGPSPNGNPIWNFRWRAEYGDAGIFEYSVCATDEFETQLEFRRDRNGTMRLAGKMVMGGYKARKFEGVKTDQETQQSKGKNKSVVGWWNSLRDPDEESREELCRGCKGAMDDSSEDESEPEPDWDAMQEKRRAEDARRAEQYRQPWPTEITGEWKITSEKSDEGTSGFMNIYYEDGRATAGCRQYYADFKINSDWHGIMRFCPVDELDTNEDNTSVEEFEKACILKDDVKAGLPPHGVHEWMIKWRGFFTDPDMLEKFNQPSPKDKITTSIIFRAGDDGKMSSSFILVGDFALKFFKGVRIGDGKPRAPNDPTIEELWEEKNFKVPPPPEAPKLWPWKSPLPKPNIEAPPPWAWDVLGNWKITSPRVAEALKIAKSAQMTMTILLANDPKNKKIGRQLWATFEFGPKVSGCMRFCPLPQNSRKADNVAKFEKLCVLKKGVWPGDSISQPGKSFQKWGFRWRALDKGGKGFRNSDYMEDYFEFSREKDGILKLEGTFCINYQMSTWKAVKVQDGNNLVGVDINTAWNLENLED